jgi:hypothetical protein
MYEAITIAFLVSCAALLTTGLCVTENRVVIVLLTLLLVIMAFGVFPPLLGLAIRADYPEVFGPLI